MIPINSSSNNVTNFLSQIEANDFTIQASGHMFSLLFKNLYADPISSVVREICANAYDAHVQANNQETPFEMHIPNSIEHNLIIKDYGCGLSDNDVWKYLSCAGESGKRETNLQQGLFGIGGKSMMAVTDSYTIESRFNGNKSIFLVFIQENGIPSMTKQKQEFTDEANGITFIIPVSNYKGYEKAIKDQLVFFNPKPSIMNHDNFQWHDIENGLENEYGSVCKINWSGKSAYWVKMGNILYPFESSKIKEEYHKTRISNFQGYIILNFDIGEINVVPSRESVSYDSVSLEKLNQKVSQFIKNIDDKWETRLNNAITVQEFYGEVIFDIYKSDKTYFQSPFFINLKRKLIDYDGSDYITDGKCSNYQYKFPSINKPLPVSGRDSVLSKYQTLSTTRNIKRELIISHKKSDDLLGEFPFNYPQYSINPITSNIIWVIVDSDKHVSDRFKEYFINNPDKPKCVTKPIKVIKISKEWKDGIDFKEIYDFQKNFQHLNITIIRTSDMPWASKQKKETDKIISLVGVYDLQKGKTNEIIQKSIFIEYKNGLISSSGKISPTTNNIDWEEICGITQKKIYRISGSCSQKTFKYMKEIGCIDLDEYVSQSLVDTNISDGVINYLVYKQLSKYAIISWTYSDGKYQERMKNLFIPKEVHGDIPKNITDFENIMTFLYDNTNLTKMFISSTIMNTLIDKLSLIKEKVNQKVGNILTDEAKQFFEVMSDIRYAKSSTLELILNMFEKEKENE